jgi:uncharacterized protein YycO
MNSYEPREGDFGVIKSRGVFARLIQVGTVSRWNHAFIYIGNGKIVEANPKGVEVSDASKYPLIAWNRHEELTDLDRKLIVQHAVEQVGKPYNFLIIFNLVLRILGLRALANTHFLYKLAQKEGYICSELVAEAYAMARCPVTTKAPDLCTPGDLAERLVYA